MWGQPQTVRVQRTKLIIQRDKQYDKPRTFRGQPQSFSSNHKKIWASASIFFSTIKSFIPPERKFSPPKAFKLQLQSLSKPNNNFNCVQILKFFTQSNTIWGKPQTFLAQLQSFLFNLWWTTKIQFSTTNLFTQLQMIWCQPQKLV